MSNIDKSLWNFDPWFINKGKYLVLQFFVFQRDVRLIPYISVLYALLWIELGVQGYLVVFLSYLDDCYSFSLSMLSCSRMKAVLTCMCSFFSYARQTCKFYSGFLKKCMSGYMKELGYMLFCSIISFLNLLRSFAYRFTN